jgi:hypothetical protein
MTSSAVGNEPLEDQVRGLQEEDPRPRTGRGAPPARGGVRGYYHTRCTGAALELVTEAHDAWRMTVRHVEEMAN